MQKFEIFSDIVFAGSEKVKDSNSSAEMLVESNNINRSLLVLGMWLLNYFFVCIIFWVLHSQRNFNPDLAYFVCKCNFYNDKVL